MDVIKLLSEWQGKAIITDETQTTYTELITLVEDKCCDLSNKGVGKGSKVLVESKYTLDFISSTLAIIQLGGIYIPIFDTIGKTLLKQRIALLKPDVLLVEKKESHRI